MGFFDLGLESVDFSSVAAGVGVGTVQLLLQVSHLALPFINGLVKGTLALLSRGGNSLGLNTSTTLVSVTYYH